MVTEVSKLYQASLNSIARMKEFLGHGPGPAWKYRLDGKGTVIFTLPDGGIIRDSGTPLEFRPGIGLGR
jgi:hypothetical protein